MEDSIIRLSVPAEPAFARSVRMMAANLAVLCAMNVDEVEDARMAAEEAFVYACATRPATLDMTFCVSATSLEMCFSLGEGFDSEDDVVQEQVALAEALMAAVSDDYRIDEDGAMLSVTKRVGAADVR